MRPTDYHAMIARADSLPDAAILPDPAAAICLASLSGLSDGMIRSRRCRSPRRAAGAGLATSAPFRPGLAAKHA
jgi:hypothetical protein